MAAAIRVIAVSPSTTLASAALFLLSSGVAARRAIGRGDAGEAAFVTAATVLVAALLAAVRAHDEGRRRRGLLLRAVAWALSAALTALFARRVAALVPAPAVVSLVWAMAGATVAGGFCCLFVPGRGDDDADGARPA